MPEPDDTTATDVEVKNPAQVEADGDLTADVEWEGITVTVPASLEDWDAKALEAFEEGKAISAINRLLGARQATELANTFREKHCHPLKVRDYGSLFEVLAKLYGFESAGE